MSLYDDDPPQPRMQPGTKVALCIIGTCAAGLVLIGISALAHHASRTQPRVHSPQPLRPPTYRVRPASTPAETDLPEADPAVAAAGAAAGAAFLGTFFGIMLICGIFAVFVVVAQILILVWVVKDARARGADGGVWLLVILLFPLIGLLVYVASRPPGILIPCSFCGNRRLDCLRLCPTCQREG